MTTTTAKLLALIDDQVDTAIDFGMFCELKNKVKPGTKVFRLWLWKRAMWQEALRCRGSKIAKLLIKHLGPINPPIVKKNGRKHK